MVDDRVNVRLQASIVCAPEVRLEDLFDHGLLEQVAI